MAGGAFLALAMADLLGTAFLPAYSRPGQAGGPAGYHLPGSTRDMIGGWRVAIVDDAVNAATAVQACFRQLRDHGAAPVAVASLLALGPADDIVTGAMEVPFYTVATMRSQAWPAADCPFCACGTPLAPA
jgi:orotate phosphoribosyltransferase-like protein